MKILVLSDSHGAHSYMEMAIRAVEPDAVVHLGDYCADGSAMAEKFSRIRFYQVAGNCDLYRNVGFIPETRVEKVCGVKLYMTHGHIQRVKTGLWSLIGDARKTEAQAVLFGHTHSPHCSREDNGMWVLNPGSCRDPGGSAAVMEVENGEILDCRILPLRELAQASGQSGAVTAASERSAP